SQKNKKTKKKERKIGDENWR
ncbi:hypothetical protein ACN38_g10969, partial [Penicillium nordicum]